MYVRERYVCTVTYIDCGTNSDNQVKRVPVRTCPLSIYPWPRKLHWQAFVVWEKGTCELLRGYHLPHHRRIFSLCENQRQPFQIQLVFYDQGQRFCGKHLKEGNGDMRRKTMAIQKGIKKCQTFLPINPCEWDDVLFSSLWKDSSAFVEVTWRRRGECWRAQRAHWWVFFL